MWENKDTRKNQGTDSVMLKCHLPACKRLPAYTRGGGA